MRQLRWLILVLLIAGGAWSLWPARVITYGPGVLIADAPSQGPADQTVWQHNGYTITPLASFELRARVLSKAKYRFGREADLSPIDLALGWQHMSDQAVLDTLSITQSGRWYHWRWSGMPPPISMSQISSQSANMHMIPATDAVNDQLARVVKGDLIAIQGMLVRVNASDGWKWQSSLSREDTGDGACELVWVESLDIMPRQ